MSALSRAHAALANAVSELEDATAEAPLYSRDALRQLQRDLTDSIRRLGNARKVLGDLDPPSAA